MSRAADRLGTSASFSRAAPAVSARRAAIAAATEAPTTGTQESRPEELPLELISQNPENPRSALGDVSDLAQTLREIGLVQAITVATVDAYLKERPDQADKLEDGAQYVVVDGHRRLAAAREAGLTHIKYIVNDGFVASDDKLLEAAYVANLHRENLSELEEATALKALVDLYGSQRKASKRLGITQAFISQRLSLLELDISLQAELEAGQRKVEHVRGLAKLPPQEQRRKADQRAAEAAKTPARERRGADDGAQSQGDNGVISPSSSRPSRAAPHVESSSGPGGDNGVITPPESRAEETDLQAIPWRDPQAVLAILREHMDSADFELLVKEALKIL